MCTMCVLGNKLLGCLVASLLAWVARSLTLNSTPVQRIIIILRSAFPIVLEHDSQSLTAKAKAIRTAKAKIVHIFISERIF